MTQAARKLTFEEYASLDSEDWIRLGDPEQQAITILQLVDG
jgi:hypothetical protein